MSRIFPRSVHISGSRFQRVLVTDWEMRWGGLICVLLCCFASVLSHTTDGDPCISLKNSSFEMCMAAGYDNTIPFPEYFTEQRKREIATELIDTLKSTKKCSAGGLAEAVECSFVAPKCSPLGDPIYPCRQVCAEFLKRCELELDEVDLDYLISLCLVLSNGSSGCAPCFEPPNFTTNDSLPGEWAKMIHVLFTQKIKTNSN